MLYRFDACEFDPAARRLLVQGVEHVLGGRAFDLLQALVENHQRVMGKDELYARVWPDQAVEPNNLQVQVWALRKVLGHQAIATVARRGYRFMPAVVCEPAPATPAKAMRPPRTRAALPGPHGLAAAALAQQLAEHRLVTLVSGDPVAGGHLVQAAAQAVSPDATGGVWQTEADVLTGRRAQACPVVPAGGEAALQAASLRLHTLLQRAGRRATVLVVLNAHQADGLRSTLQQLLAELPRLRLLVSHTQALGLPEEKPVQGPARPEPGEAGAPSAAAGHMRWRPRG